MPVIPHPTNASCLGFGVELSCRCFQVVHLISVQIHGWLLYFGDELLPSSMGTVTSHCYRTPDPY